MLYRDTAGLLYLRSSVAASWLEHKSWNGKHTTTKQVADVAKVDDGKGDDKVRHNYPIWVDGQGHGAPVSREA